MTIPDYQKMMLPLLKLSGDGEEHTRKEAIDHLSEVFGLTEAEREQLLPFGRQRVLDNRVDWARARLTRARLTEPTSPGSWRITPRGRGVLKENPSSIDLKYLSQFPEFAQSRERGGEAQAASAEEDESYPEHTPSELLEKGSQRIRDELAQELLDRVGKVHYSFFERLVVELLVKMGYGGSQKDAGQAIGKSGDGGIDGVIKQDKLGLDNIYVQPKKWQGTVGRPEIQKFVGALQMHKASKGIFITTSRFSDEATEYPSTVPLKIILIDGERLAELMIDYDC